MHVALLLKQADTPSQALLRNIKTYAERHGYGILFFDKNVGESSDRHVLWSKIPALYYALAHLSTPYLWWQDADSLFVLPERSLESLKPTLPKSLTIAGDHNCYINSGHFMLRNSSWTYQVAATSVLCSSGRPRYFRTHGTDDHARFWPAPLLSAQS